MKKNYRRSYLYGLSKKIKQCNHTDDLFLLLRTSQGHLQQCANFPHYNVYTIPKKDGSLRTIEDPSYQLKKLQQCLNTHLQAHYYFHCSQAAYGFIVQTKSEEFPRNIYTNALQHCGRPYLLNMDLEDFFYSVSIEAVYRLFNGSLFNFTEESSDLLARLCTHVGRLPMGAPTSPVLSNFAVLELDHALLDHCNANSITYTRYVDDMTFSSKQEITEAQIHSIENIIGEHNFRLNQKKKKLCGPTDVKMVTGLKVTDIVTLPDSYLSQLMQEVNTYGNMLIANNRYPHPAAGKQKHAFHQELEGKLQFAERIMGARNAAVKKVRHQKDQVEILAEDFESINWLDLPYKNLG